MAGCGYFRGPLDSREAKYKENLLNFRPWGLTLLTKEKDSWDETGRVAQGVCRQILSLGYHSAQTFPACFQSGDTYLIVDYCSKMKGLSFRMTKDQERVEEKRKGRLCIPTRRDFPVIDARLSFLEFETGTGRTLRQNFGVPEGRGEGRYTYSFGAHERENCRTGRWYSVDYIFRLEGDGLLNAIDVVFPGKGC